MSSKQADSPLGYELRVENFGKLADAEIRVGDFTVLAGPNNTGKSFVSKLLYSIFSALDADLPRVRVWRLVSSFTRQVEYLRLIGDHPTTDHLRGMAGEMRQAAFAYSNGEIESLDDVVTQINEVASRMEDIVDRTTLHDDAASDRRVQRFSDGLSNLRESLQQLTSALAKTTDIRAFSLAEFQDRTKRALIRNFQVPDIDSLASDAEKDIVVSISELLELTARGDSVDLAEGESLPALPPGHQNVVYIESPVYWKLFDALQGRRQLLNRPGRERLTGVPEYFYELARAIKLKYTGKAAFPDVHGRLVGEDAINGEVAMSESGDIVFEEAGRSFPLATASAGVANVGVLAMLIERKVIDHGTMLFIDEPEAHLHPAWQVVVSEALFQLARKGARVVLATHSLDILKWLEVHLKENPDEEKHVALNRFPDPIFDGEDVATKLGSIKDDLTKPFVDLYMRGL